MRVRLLGLAAAGMAAAGMAVVVGTTPASADSGKFNPPKQYYLSLGDSLAFGYQQDKLITEFFSGTYSPSDFPGYTYAFGDLMRAVDPRLTVVDYGCPAETTISFTTACDFQDVDGVQLHDGYPGRSQESAALGFLRAHPGQVSPITVSLGGNDFLAAGSSLADIQARLTRILRELRAAAPDAEIIVLQSYNPLTFFVQDPIPDAVFSALNGVIGAAAASAGARTADVFAVFNNPNPPPPATELTNICMWTLICTPSPIAPDGHATDSGYRKMADIFWEASGYGRLTPGD